MNPNSNEETPTAAATGDERTEPQDVPDTSIVTALSAQEMGVLRTMLSLFTSFRRRINVEADDEKDLRSININIKQSTDVSETSNLSSVSGSAAVVNQLNEIKCVLSEMNQSLKALACVPTAMTPLKLQQQHSALSVRSDEFTDDGEVLSERKSDFFVKFKVSAPDGTDISFYVLPPKHFMTLFGGKATRQFEKKGISTDPLKLLLVCAWKTFINESDRVILPVVLEWETDATKDVADFGKLWQKQVNAWCPVENRSTGKYSALAIVSTSSGPILFVFSYDFGDTDTLTVEPMLTAYVSERKAVPTKFPWTSLASVFMDLLLVEDSNVGVTVSPCNTRTVAFLEQTAYEKIQVSNLFPIKDDDFHITLPSNTWRVNDYSLAVFGVVSYCSKNLSGRMKEPVMNIFLNLVKNLTDAMAVDVPTFRNAICKVLWDVFLKLVTMKATMLKNTVSGDDLEEGYDEKAVLQGFKDEIDASFGGSNVKKADEIPKKRRADATNGTTSSKKKKGFSSTSAYAAHK